MQEKKLIVDISRDLLMFTEPDGETYWVSFAHHYSQENEIGYSWFLSLNSEYYDVGDFFLEDVVNIARELLDSK